MKTSYLDPFVEAAVEVLKQIVTDGKVVVKKQLYLSNNISEIYDLAVIISLAGEVIGRVIIDMSTETALKVASDMNKEIISELNDLAKATLNELTNIIVGNAVTKLHDLGYKFDIAPPLLITGKNLKINDLKLESFVVPLIIPQGTIEINVAIKEK